MTATGGTAPRIRRGTYECGPGRSVLELYVYREGKFAAVGFDIVLEAGRWSARLTADPDDPRASRVRVAVGVDRLILRKAEGGLKKLVTDDGRRIQERICQILRADRYPEIVFTGRGADLTGRTAVTHGELEIMGRTEPLDVTFRFDERPDGPHITGEAQVVQTRWGITPYRGKIGLQVRDLVDVRFDLLLDTPD